MSKRARGLALPGTAIARPDGLGDVACPMHHREHAVCLLHIGGPADMICRPI